MRILLLIFTVFGISLLGSLVGQSDRESDSPVEAGTDIPAEVDPEAATDLPLLPGPDLTEATNAEFVAVSNLESIAANEEFQRNAALVNRQVQQIRVLNGQIETAEEEAVRNELLTRREALLARLNENNQMMMQTYGYNVARNYQMVVKKAHIYMYVTPAELKEIEKRRNAEGSR